MLQAHNNTVKELSNRILLLIPDHLEILEMSDPQLLLKIEGFSKKGINHTYFITAYALSKAKELYKSQKK